MTIEEMMEHMVSHGSSMNIGWGEDTGCFEVDWITGGKRFRGVDRSLSAAALQAIRNAATFYGVEVPA